MTAATHNILALDVGERRIGIAVASLEARMASPLLTLDRQTVDNVFAALQRICEEQGIQEIVIGLPRGMSGQETAQTAIARAFADELADHINLPLHLQDEAGTSLAAEEMLAQKQKTYSKADIDKTAAAIILDDWLQNANTEVTS